MCVSEAHMAAFINAWILLCFIVQNLGGSAQCVCVCVRVCSVLKFTGPVSKKSKKSVKKKGAAQLPDRNLSNVRWSRRALLIAVEKIVRKIKASKVRGSLKRR